MTSMRFLGDHSDFNLLWQY